MNNHYKGLIHKQPGSRGLTSRRHDKPFSSVIKLSKTNKRMSEIKKFTTFKEINVVFSFLSPYSYPISFFFSSSMTKSGKENLHLFQIFFLFRLKCFRYSYSFIPNLLDSTRPEYILVKVCLLNDPTNAFSTICFTHTHLTKLKEPNLLIYLCGTKNDWFAIDSEDLLFLPK